MTSRLYVLPSASSLERAKACPASFSLPQAHEESTAASTLGTAVHAFLARAREIGRDDALAEISLDADHYRFCELIPWDKLPRGGRAESAFAYDYAADAARMLELTEARRYELRENEIAGTADLVGVSDGVAYVADWKTGYRTLTPAAESMQLRFLGLAAARAFGVDAVRVEYFRLRDDGSFWVDSATFDVFDLMDIAQQVNGIVHWTKTAQDIPDASRSVTLGAHCDYCPAFASCPGQTSLARAMVQYTAPGPLTIEDAAKAWETLSRYDEIADRVRKSLREFAKITPFPAGPGKEVRQVERSYSAPLDPTITRDVLVKRFGAELAEEAFEQKVSQSSVEGVVRKGAARLGLKLSDVKREVFGELEKRRALVHGTRPEVRVSKAKSAE